MRTDPGRRAERFAAWWLRLFGWRILARRYRVRQGEIDLIARRGRVVAFVEIKARPDLSTAAEAIRPKQQQRIARAAAVYLAAHPDLAALDCRFDAVLVLPRRFPRHLPDAWREA